MDGNKQESFIILQHFKIQSWSQSISLQRKSCRAVSHRLQSTTQGTTGTITSFDTSTRQSTCVIQYFKLLQGSARKLVIFFFATNLSWQIGSQIHTTTCKGFIKFPKILRHNFESSTLQLGEEITIVFLFLKGLRGT